jgi:hypothetical protein
MWALRHFLVLPAVIRFISFLFSYLAVSFDILKHLSPICIHFVANSFGRLLFQLWHLRRLLVLWYLSTVFSLVLIRPLYSHWHLITVTSYFSLSLFLSIKVSLPHITLTFTKKSHNPIFVLASICLGSSVYFFADIVTSFALYVWPELRHPKNLYF